MQKSRRRPHALQFDPLEGRALLSSAAAVLPAPQAPALVSTQVNGFPIQIETDEFENKGGRTDYELEFLSGRYRFNQDYRLKIKKIGNDAGPGLTAVDAMGIYLDRAGAQIENLLYGNGDAKAASVNNGYESDYVIKSESFRNRGGKTTYKLVIESGNYRFDQEWTLKIKKANNGTVHGASALQAIEYFVDKLYINVENLLASPIMTSTIKKRI